MPRKKRKNKLEKEFEGILKEMKLKYKFHFVFMNKEFDFLLLDHNILIEVDGDFYHVNESLGYTAKYDIQKQNIKNDKEKNKLVNSSSKYILLRFWEYDIKNNKNWVIKTIKYYISN